MAPHHATTASEQQEKTDRTPSNAVQVEDSTGPATIQKTTTSRRAKRASPQTETAQLHLDQSLTNTLADVGDLDMPGTPQTTPAGESPFASPSQEEGTLDIFTGLSEAEAGLPALTDDLNDIDGGGLPSVARKSPQKSKR